MLACKASVSDSGCIAALISAALVAAGDEGRARFIRISRKSLVGLEEVRISVVLGQRATAYNFAPGDGPGPSTSSRAMDRTAVGPWIGAAGRFHPGLAPALVGSVTGTPQVPLFLAPGWPRSPASTSSSGFLGPAALLYETGPILKGVGQVR
jgi:hypothetical protein